MTQKDDSGMEMTLVPQDPEAKGLDRDALEALLMKMQELLLAEEVSFLLALEGASHTFSSTGGNIKTTDGMHVLQMLTVGLVTGRIDVTEHPYLIELSNSIVMQLNKENGQLPQAPAPRSVQ